MSQFKYCIYFQPFENVIIFIPYKKNVHKNYKLIQFHVILYVSVG